MARHPLALMPVVTVVEGRAALAPDAYGRSTGQAGPAEAVASWAAQGAAWVHVDDRDAAAGRPTHQVGAGSARVQYAAEVGDDARLAAALAAGASRVVVRSDDPAWAAAAAAAHGDRVAVALDARRPDLVAAAQQLQGAGCRRLVVTDAGAAHAWHHGDRHLLEDLCHHVHVPVVAGTGVTSVGELHALMELVPHGLDGILLDEALTSGALTYAEAAAACADRFDLFFWGPAE